MQLVGQLLMQFNSLFPSMAPTSVKTFDFVELQQRIKKINAWDKKLKS